MTEHTTLPPHTTNDVLQALVPLGLHTAQRLDFAGWLSGYEEGRLVSLNELSAGDRAFIVQRLQNANTDALKAEWTYNRTRQGDVRTFNARATSRDIVAPTTAEEWLR